MNLSVWLHRLNLVAVALVFIHVQLISYMTAVPSYIWLFNGYTAVVLGCYVYQKIRSTWGVPRGRLVAKRQLAPNFYEFTFQLRQARRLVIQAGDYVFLRFPNTPGLREGHPLSVVNPVTTEGRLVLAIRGDGDFTRQIQQVPIGVTAAFAGGYGHFSQVIKDYPQARLVLAGGGTGAIPLLAVIAAYPDKAIAFYYAAHTSQQLIYVDELRRLAADHPQLNLHIQEGRFEPEK